MQIPCPLALKGTTVINFPAPRAISSSGALTFRPKAPESEKLLSENLMMKLLLCFDFECK